MLKSKMMNDFEYCTNEMPKLLLLEGLSIYRTVHSFIL